MSMFSFLRTGSSSSAANVVSSPSTTQPEVKELKSESESGGFFSLHDISSTRESSKVDVSTVVEGGK